MSRVRIVLGAIAVFLGGCQANVSEPGPPVPDTVVVQGIQFTGHVDNARDSLHAELEIINTRSDSGVVKVGGCSVSLLAYGSSPRGNRKPVWDEMDRADCPEMEVWIQLAPGEREVLTHKIPERGVFTQENPLPPGQYYFVLRVATSEPILVSAGNRRIRVQ